MLCGHVDVPGQLSGCWGTILKSQFLPSTLVWVPRVGPRSPGVCGKGFASTEPSHRPEFVFYMSHQLSSRSCS